MPYNIRQIAREMGTPGFNGWKRVWTAVNRLKIKPVKTNPVRYLLDERQYQAVKELLKRWDRGEKPLWKERVK